MNRVGWWDNEHARLGIGGLALLVATSALVRVEAPLPVFAVVLAGLDAWFSRGVGIGEAALLGLTAWGLFTGFGVNELGQLTLASMDLSRLAAFLICSLVIARRGVPAQ